MRVKFLLWLLRFVTSSLYNYIDKNKDGKIDKEEIQNALGVLKNLEKKILNRDKKGIKINEK